MRIILFFFFLITTPLYAQKHASDENITAHFIDLRKSNSSFKKIFIGKSELNEVREYLLNNIPNLQYFGAGLELGNTVESLTGVHFLFIQMYNGVEVYRGGVKVNMDKTGNIISMFDNTFSFDGLNPGNSFPDVSVIDQSIDPKSSSDCYFFTSENKCIPGKKINYFTHDKKDIEAVVDKNGTILYSRDQNVYFRAMSSIDSAVSAMVFLPDPLTTAGVTYGGSYVDGGDADIAALNNERVSVNIRVKFSGDTFYLESPYVRISDFAPPTAAPAFSVSNPVFNYTRSQTGFEDVNAYYHITAQQKHIQSLGFSNIVAYPIWVDTHGATADNSYFSYGFNPPRLNFGTGGVDDAEDADVIIHEYGHAIMYSASPGSNTGTERTALDEANSDYFAASYSRIINSFNWQNVYTWDGHNPFWPGRLVISSKHYPEDKVGNIYLDTDIWSATLMQIWEEIGRDEADATLIESAYGYAPNMTMEDAASLYMLADASLYAGKNADVICTHFFNRGLFSNCQINPNDGKTIHIFNSKGYSDGTGAIIRFKDSVAWAKFTIYTVLGQELSAVQKENISSYVMKGDLLPKGIYIVKVETPVETASFQLIND